MTIPFVDLKSQYADIKEAVQGRINAVLDHGKYVMGPEVAELEGALAELTGCPYVVGCSSGTDALVMALMAHGIGPGDAVITSPFTFFATAEAIEWVGARPVFVDIDPITFNLDPAGVQTAVAEIHARGWGAPRAIVAVDIFGLPADYQTLAAVAMKHDMLLLGDGAQSLGSAYQGKPTAVWPDIYTTSFFPAKPLGCYGDGGAVFTSRGDIDEVLRSIRVHGSGRDQYDSVRIGINGRLDSIQAAVLLAKLPRFAAEIERRQWAAGRYTKRLQGVVQTPTVPEGYRSAWAQYTVVVDDRDAIAAALKQVGIPSAVYYSKPLHLQPALAHLGYAEGTLPHAEGISRKVLSLPMHPYLEQSQIDEICDVITKAVESR